MVDPGTIALIVKLVPSLTSGIAQFLDLAKAEDAITDEEIEAIEAELDDTHDELMSRIQAAKNRIAEKG